MPTTISPIYGRFEFESIALLTDRLTQISEKFLDATQFTAYLVTQSNQKFYGLDYKELQAEYEAHVHEVIAISASASTSGGRVVRVSIRFYAGPGTAKGQFVISTGSKRRNEAIKKMLLGEWIPGTVFEEDEEQDTTSRDVSFEGLSIPPIRIRPKPSLSYPKTTYSQPTITLTDHFYFDPYVSADTLVDLVNRLSDTFLHGAYFHIRLETTDGDYHLNMNRYELRYMFNRRREKLLMLYMDAATLDGQWINIRLSYHPLTPGPNGEMDITSHQTDDIMGVVVDTIGKESPENALPARLNETCYFDASRFSVRALVRLFNEISRDYLHQIPPIAFLSTTRGESYTGLSCYQLEKIFWRNQHEVEVLSVGITNVMTGQMLSLMFQFRPEYAHSFVSLSMMWGDIRKHEAVKALIWERLELESDIPRHKPVITSERQLYKDNAKTCVISISWEMPGADALLDHIDTAIVCAGWKPMAVRSIYAHKQWEDTINALHQADLVVADLTYKHPDVLYKVGMAQALGKKVIILAQDNSVIPREFRTFSYIRYENSPLGLEILAEELEILLT